MRKNFLLSIVAVALFAGAGILMWRRYHVLADDVPQALRRVPPATAGSDAGSDRPILKNLLAREIFRQGILMAERDAGLEVRDRVLEGTGSTDDVDPNAWDVYVGLIQMRGIDVKLIPRGKPAVWQTLIPYKNDWLDYLDLAEKSESFSRKEFRETIGLDRPKSGAATLEADPARNAAPPPSAEKMEQWLGEMSIIPQFYAVRAAHRAIRANGETPALLGVLVRGYANLGQLTQYMWSTAPKAFAARSMLYAQRMIARWPADPAAYWHRAYAVAFAGLQGAALTDLDEAAKLAAAKPAPEPPAWVSLLRNYCHYETRQLGESIEKLAEAHSPLVHLAQFMAFLTLESCNSPSLIVSVGNAFLSDNPDCFRVMDRMIEGAGVSSNHQLTLDGPEALKGLLATRLSGLPDLPEKVRSALTAAKRNSDDLKEWAKVTDALLESPAVKGDELPWRALGQMVRETQFVQAERRTGFLVNGLGVNALDEVNACRPLVEHHRYRGLIELRGLNHPGTDEKRMVLNDMAVIDPVPTMTALYVELFAAGLRPRVQDPGESLSYYQWSGRFKDNTSTDFERILRTLQATATDKQFFMYCAQELHRASPDAPLYMAKMIELDWPTAEPQVPKWQETWGDHPTLAGALGKQYAKLKRWGDSEKYLRLYMTKAPDTWACEMLAQAILRQGREDEWLATLKEGLTQPDYALDHASLNWTIASHYVDRRQFEKAKPYADAAAGSYAAFGLTIAAQCEEGLGNWSVAEDWIQRDAERYDRLFNWYAWCVRTGKGNLEEAEKVAIEYLRSPRPDLGKREPLTSQAAHELFSGKRLEAEKTLRKSVRNFNDTWSAMHVALLRDAAGDAAGRDEALKALIDIAEQNPPSYSHPRPQTEWVRPRIAELGKAYVSANSSGKLDPAVVEKIIQDTNRAKERMNLSYFAGRIFELRGDKENALKYLKRAAASPDNASVNCVLAWIELRALGFDPTTLYKADSDVVVDRED